MSQSYWEINEVLGFSLGAIVIYRKTFKWFRNEMTLQKSIHESTFILSLQITTNKVGHWCFLDFFEGHI